MIRILATRSISAEEFEERDKQCVDLCWSVAVVVAELFVSLAGEELETALRGIGVELDDVALRFEIK
jgi:hypothetical protein